MPAQPATFREIEEEVVSRITAIGASQYSGDGEPALWHESEAPLQVAQESTALQHLAFNAWIQSAPNSDLERDSEIDGYMWVEAALIVLFVYELPPGAQTAEARIATDAAIDVLRVLMAPWDANKGCANVRCVNALQPSLTADGGWLQVRQDYTIGFDLLLDASLTTDPRT